MLVSVCVPGRPLSSSILELLRLDLNKLRRASERERDQQGRGTTQRWAEQASEEQSAKRAYAFLRDPPPSTDAGTYLSMQGLTQQPFDQRCCASKGLEGYMDSRSPTRRVQT